MPPGEVEQSTGNDGFLKSGYLKRYDLYDDDGMPSRIPVLNSQNMDPGDPVVFDVFQISVNEGDHLIFVPVAVIRDFVDTEDWEKEWNNAENAKDKIKVKPNSFIFNNENESDLKTKVGNRIGVLRGKNLTKDNSGKLKILK